MNSTTKVMKADSIIGEQRKSSHKRKQHTEFMNQSGTIDSTISVSSTQAFQAAAEQIINEFQNAADKFERFYIEVVAQEAKNNNTIRIAMQELNKEIFRELLEDKDCRNLICDYLTNAEHAEEFLLFDDNIKVQLLQSIVS